MFKYHPDNVIYKNYCSQCKFADFVALNPDFPITEGSFFEYNKGVLEFINSAGHHVEANITDHQELVDAIESNSYSMPVPPPPPETEPEITPKV
tara:strand:- start:21 stop:302 length:282 start_codon:yes stop_codon:yes gene_type:complete